MDIYFMAVGALILPLAGAFCARFFGHRCVYIAKYVPMFASLGALLLSLGLLRDVGYLGKPIDLFLYRWLDYQGYFVQIGLWLDSITVMMMVIITSITLVVQLYSLGYMQKDPQQHRYFSYIAFFSFMMLVLVMANNLLQLFIGWEGVGLASYLLIGFWQQKVYAEKAAIKAFVMNRIADCGLLMAMGLLFYGVGDIHYPQILSQSQVLFQTQMGPLVLGEWICLGFLIASMGKSAQLPLQAWLPDSMAGPTPISALIHAATMVTAGVYLLARFAPLFEQANLVRQWVMCVGFAGMILMGLVALFERDLKRVVAYSTLSQLGMMFGVAGASGYVFSLYHLATHAQFKALLFLGSGAIIWRANEQDITKIGHMRKQPIIHLVMFIGLAAMMAIPPLSGFYSKDAMILFLSDQPALYAMMVAGAVITGLYSTRLYYWLFWQPHSEKSPNPVPLTMYYALGIMVFFAIMGGYMMAPYLVALTTVLQPHPQLIALIQDTPRYLDHAFSSLSLTLVLASSVLCFYVLKCQLRRLEGCYQKSVVLIAWIKSQYGLNTFYEVTLFRGYQKLSDFLCGSLDQWMIDQTLVEGVPRRMNQLSCQLQRLADGKLYHYVLLMFVGVMVLMMGVL